MLQKIDDVYTYVNGKALYIRLEPTHSCNPQLAEIIYEFETQNESYDLGKIDGGIYDGTFNKAYKEFLEKLEPIIQSELETAWENLSDNMKIVTPKPTLEDWLFAEVTIDMETTATVYNGL